MIVKICGLGCKGYARDAYNLFDGILVTISVFDWVLDTFDLFPLNTSVITVFRSLRVLKIVKLATKNEDLQILLEAIKMTVVEIMNYLLLLALYIFICALVGMELYAYRI